MLANKFHWNSDKLHASQLHPGRVTRYSHLFLTATVWLYRILRSIVTELVKVDSLQCNRPHNSHHAAIEALAVGTPIIVYLAILLRIVGRLWTIRNLWWDDYFHILGGVSRF